MMLRTTAILLALSIVPAAAPAQPPSGAAVRIGLLESARSFNLSGEGKYLLQDAAGREQAFIPSNDYLVTAKGAAVEIAGTVYRGVLRAIPARDDGPVRINGRRYRGAVSIEARGGKLTVVNELGLEEYLYGILPREVNPAWPAESLKAQAVVSRTYALKNIRRHGQSGFDLCDETHCQVYGGMESESEATNRAVDGTRGEVLFHGGEIAQTFFHASCGGHTETPDNVWSWDTRAPAYLKGRKDIYCGNSPHNVWKNRISAAVIEARLNKAGYPVRKIASITMKGKSSSGRVRTLAIKHAKGTLNIPAARFRLAVDTWLIKSTLFKRISRSGKQFEFSGVGWGHGVGLCQWGAKEMAEKGIPYSEILEYFYPGTALERKDE